MGNGASRTSDDTATGTVTVDVAPVDDAPTAVDDGPLALDRDDRLVIEPSLLLANDADVEGDTLGLLGVVDSPVHGTLGFDASGRLVYVPDDGFVGEDAFGYRVGDETLDESGSAWRVHPSSIPRSRWWATLPADASP